MAITTLTINPAIDLTLEVDSVIVEDVNRVQEYSEVAGGKGINVSLVLNKFKIKQLDTLALLGGQRGLRFKRLLSQKGLRLTPVQIKNETRVNVVAFDRTAHKTTKFNQKGPNLTKREEVQLIALSHQKALKSQYFIISGSLLPNMKKDWYKQLILKNKDGSTHWIVDADGDVLKETLKAKPFLIKPNVHEAERVLKTKIKSDKDVWKAARQFQKLGAQNVALSLGSKGACLLDSNGNRWRGFSVPVKVHSTIGAGDSFLAGIVYKLHQKKDFKEALRFGLACGTHTAMTHASELCDPKEVKKILKKIKVIKVNEQII